MAGSSRGSFSLNSSALADESGVCVKINSLQAMGRIERWRADSLSITGQHQCHSMGRRSCYFFGCSVDAAAMGRGFIQSVLCLNATGNAAMGSYCCLPTIGYASHELQAVENLNHHLPPLFKLAFKHCWPTLLAGTMHPALPCSLTSVLACGACMDLGRIHVAHGLHMDCQSCSFWD